MNIRNFTAGTWHRGYNYQYFLPDKINHGFICSDESIYELLELASLKLGELNSFSRFVPDADMFIRMHVFNEAVFSSRIEGTQTNIEEALLEAKEIVPERRDDWQEVNNYVAAINYAMKELEYLPLSTRIIKETHRKLMQSVRGEKKNPGEFRTSQNWIGGATLKDAIFIPPAHNEIHDLMNDLDLFLNNNEIRVPHLIRIAIAHYQFETIHPFLDGNGRIGRVLIALYLVSTKILEKPLLYLSDFFERNKSLYYDNLTRVRTHNDLTQWLKFFLTAVTETAQKSVSTLYQIIHLKNTIEKKLFPLLGKRLNSGQKLLSSLFSQPTVSGKFVEKTTELSPKAANELLDFFVEQSILREVTGYQRNRIFVFTEYLQLFGMQRGK